MQIKKKQVDKTKTRRLKQGREQNNTGLPVWRSEKDTSTHGGIFTVHIG